MVADPDGPRRPRLSRDRAPHGARGCRSRPRPRRRSQASPSRTPDREHQVRPLDPPHGREPRHDRAVRARPGARGGRPAHRLLRHLELRLRRALRRRVQDLHQHQLDHRRPEGLRPELASSTSSGEVCIIPPNSFALARTVEYFRIPRNVLTVCLGKSTYARCGIIVNVTPLEPEWEGHVTLEFSNTTPLPAKIYANEGVAQMLFFESRRGLRDLVHATAAASTRARPG
ncbi:MAG: dCTP deaminase [Desulfobacterales bacterium]|nr:dCTP deaminase [Desulfobacterales bacterium]